MLEAWGLLPQACLLSGLSARWPLLSVLQVIGPFEVFLVWVCSLPVIHALKVIFLSTSPFWLRCLPVLRVLYLGYLYAFRLLAICLSVFFLCAPLLRGCPSTYSYMSRIFILLLKTFNNTSRIPFFCFDGSRMFLYGDRYLIKFHRSRIYVSNLR